MLPWRRSKFVLVKKEKKKKSLSPPSLLSSFLRSCPDLLTPVPLGRLGKVFSTRRQTVEVTQQDPSYTVWYLGNAVTLRAKGEGCTVDSVKKIWEQSDSGRSSTKMKMSLGTYGIRMSPCARGSRKAVHAYLLHRITYCVGDTGHPKVFSWVYRHQIKNKAVVLRCHAVLVSKAEKAKAMALLLCQTSLATFNEFKRQKRQSDFRRGQQELLGPTMVPLVPLRKLLNGTCPYHPLADRSRCIPRLCSILEEDEDGEEQPCVHHLGTSYTSQEDRDTILELARELRRLSIQRTFSKHLTCSYPQLPDWQHPMRTIC
ncbi:protein FAM43B [Discoglossus pictus]